MINKNLLIKYIFAFLLIVPMAKVSVAQINNNSSRGLLADIPEPPNARTELPSPVPMVYRFMGALMEGEYDVCLSNFDVQTFLELIFGKALARMEKDEYNELYSYQIQTHRNEFRFLSRIMNRVAGGAIIDYSDPRYNGRAQCKVVIRLDTNRGRFDYEVYCRYTRGRWYVYDYILNNQRLTKVFKDSMQGVTASRYMESLRLFYAPIKGTRPLRNKEYEFSMLVPTKYQLKENVTPTLLATLTGLGGRFLLHVQAANYETPQTLAQVGKDIKDTLMPFNPRLYDQWKADIAGVEVGNILFHFTQGNRLLFCHMVLIPLGKKLVIMNFYHSSLQVMKHMTNIRETMVRSLTLPRIEAAGGVMPGQFADEVGLPSSSDNEFGDGSSLSDDSLSFDDDNSFNNDTTFDNENSFSESQNNPEEPDDSSFNNYDNDSDDNDLNNDSNFGNDDGGSGNDDNGFSDNDIPPSYDDNSEEEDNFDWEGTSSSSTSSGDDDEMLRPDSFVADEEEEDIERPTSIPSSGGGYGDGHFGDSDDYDFGEEVAF